MTREPLMLSDTAMVLLRRYVELQEEAFETLSRSSDNESYKSLETTYWSVLSEFHQELEHVAAELLSEVGLLWSFPDLVPLRYLEWHFTFDTDFMHLLSGFF